MQGEVRRRHPLGVVLTFVLLVSLLPVLPGPEASAAPGESTDPAPNPDLDKACGLDVLMILDESGSINTSNATEDVRRAFRAFVASLNNTGSSMAVTEFSKQARLPSIGGLPGGTYVTIDDGTTADFEAYIANQYNPGGNTNWEDAFRVGRYFAPRPEPDIPHLIVFITDGDPTQVIRNSRVTFDPGNPNVDQNQYELLVPLADNQTTGARGNAGARPAIANANAQKDTGSKVLAIGVGNALSNSGSRNRLQQVSGPDVFDGTGTFDIATTDVYLERDFAQLENALREAAFQLCAPSVTVRKVFDPTPDPNSLDDAIPGVGWTLTGTVTAPPPGSFDWVLPGPPGASPPATRDAVTDGAGFATFQWTPTNPNGDSSITVIEAPPPGSDPFVNVQSETACTFRTPDTADQPLDISPQPGGFVAPAIPPESIVTCTLVNTAVPAPSIDLEKLTDGVQGDDPTTDPVARIPVGQPFEWTYEVTNTGNVTLSSITVTDVETFPSVGDPGPAVTCPQDSLGPGESMECTASGVSGTLPGGGAFTGLYRNRAEVTGTPSTGGPDRTDSDPSSYFAVLPGISVEKSTNGVDADLPDDAPPVAVGGAVDWEYVIENSGNDPLTDVTLTDDQLGDITASCAWPGAIGELAVGATATCTPAAGTATAGLYANVAVVEATSAAGTVSDTDPSHYFGVVSGIDIEKATNGEDADSPTGPALRVGDPVLWTYEVTNTGNFVLTSFTVTDDQGVAVACPRIGVLFPGDTVTCLASGTVQPGQYQNEGTVRATDVLNRPLTDSDPSHYLGIQPSLTLEKSTNGDDADVPTGPFVPVGGPVTWEFVATNTGTSTLTDVVIADFRPGLDVVTVDCGAGFDGTLDPAESVTCQATGTAVEGQYVNLGAVGGTDEFGERIVVFDPSHYFGATSGVSLEKFTNGVDADEPQGPLVPVGDPVEWTYLVRNTGNSPLTITSLVDDQLGDITCPTTALPVDEQVICTATGTAERGPYANVATVTAVDPTGQVASDTDPSHYVGFELGIEVEKATNGEDADTPTGPLVPVGDTVTWTYVVTNPGDIALRDVALSDDQGVTPVFEGGDANGDGKLDPTETWTYTASGTAVAGQYANTATVTGSPDFEDDPTVLTDTDPSHYFGVGGAIDLEKATNGVDADTPDGAPLLALGDPVVWTYVVANESNGPISGIEVTDDVIGVITCPTATLAAGEAMTCEATGTADVDGLYANTGTVTATDATGAALTDVDPSHYRAAEAGVDIEKSTNGVDSDISPGEEIPIGDEVVWEYVVTSAGLPLGGIVVTDDRGVAPVYVSGDTDADDVLDPDETWVYRATGTAVAGAYSNIGTVVGTPQTDAPVTGLAATPVTDSDPSHYVGVEVGGIGELPETGMETAPWLYGGLALLGAGLVLLRTSRRFA